jgi:hypothetical protein
MMVVVAWDASIKMLLVHKWLGQDNQAVLAMTTGTLTPASRVFS